MRDGELWEFESDRRQGWQRSLGLERQSPLLDLVAKEGEFQSGMPVRIGREIAQTAQQQRSAAHDVASGMVVKGDGDLDKALQKLALGLGSGSPDILQDFVGFKELGGIKEDKALVKDTVEIVLGRLIHGNATGGFSRRVDNGSEGRERAHRTHLAASHAAVVRVAFLTRGLNNNTLNNIP